MDESAWQAWGLIGVCAAPTLVGAWVIAMRYALNHEEFRRFVVRTLEKRYRDKLDKVLRAVPAALVAELVRRALALDLSRHDPAARSDGYRSPQVGRSYEERLREALRPALKELSGRLNRAWAATLPGLVPVVALPLLGHWPSSDTWPFVVAGALALMALGCTKSRHTIRRSFDLALADLAPLLEDGCHRPRDEHGVEKHPARGNRGDVRGEHASRAGLD